MQLKELFKKLYEEYGPQHWWPARSKFEVCVGAILTQNTAWRNVEKAIANLRSARLLSLEKIASADVKKLAELIKPTGYYNQKAHRLKLFCNYVLEKYSSLDNFFSLPLEELRKELLSINGIGEETADSIILYAANKPTFVVDAYTRRIVSRVYGIDFSTYSDLKQFFEDNLPKSTNLFNEFHALLVEHAKLHCRKKPSCAGCVLLTECKFYNNNKGKN